MNKIILGTLIVTSVAAQAALVKYQKKVTGGSITFVREASMTPEEFSKVPYNQKPDQAYLQNMIALSADELKAIQAKDFDNMTQEEIDQIYVRLTSGPIQVGDYEGNIVVKKESIKPLEDKMVEKFKSGNKVVENVGTKFCGLFGNKSAIACLGELTWGGKRIHPIDPSTGTHKLENAISPALATAVYKSLNGVFNFGGFQIVKRMSRFNDSLLPTKSMLFPAHVYCGQSLLDHRRESIIIDYAYGSDFEPFMQGLDDLVGRGYMNIRDEIRMVRPGLYLGRAYLNNIFVLNFVLENKKVTSTIGDKWYADSCFNGKTTR